MIKPQEIHSILIRELPGAEVTVQDLTGTEDHFEVIVMWSGFNGKNLIEQHQVINKVLTPRLEDGSIHALKIKTLQSN